MMIRGSDGFIGIGTINPSYKLSVIGAGYFSANLDAAGFTEGGSNTLSNDISGNAATSTTASDLSCTNCITGTEISVLTDADISNTLTASQVTCTDCIANSEVVDALTISSSGIVDGAAIKSGIIADARIPPAITRDSELGAFVPSGAIMAFYLASCPTGWIEANGSSSTPDLRGIFIRGAGNNSQIKMSNGDDFAATYGEYMNDSFQGHWHRHRADDGDGSSVAGAETSNANVYDWNRGGMVRDPYSDGTNGVPRTGAETAPASYALTYCMKQ